MYSMYVIVNYISTIGQYIRLELECVSSAPFLSRMQEYGHVSVFSLLPHENQMSVLHFNCQRVLRGQVNCAVNDAVIKSKDTILVQVRFRKDTLMLYVCMYV